MNLSALLAEQIFIMAAMILFGYIFTKLKLIKPEISPGLSQFCLYLVSPCLLVDAFQIEFSVDKARGFLLAVIAAILIHLFLFAISDFALKIFHLTSVEKASIIYTNAGNLLVPVVSYVLGKEYIFYCSAFMAVQIFLMWTHGLSLVVEKKEYSLRKIVTNPALIATCIGLLMFFTGLHFPVILGASIERLGSCIGPISMVIVGILIATADLKAVFMRGKSWIVVGIRLLICPVIIALIIRFTGATSILPDSEKILFVSFLAGAAPAASTITQMANIHQKNDVLASSINIMSTLLCVASMPFVTMIYQFLCMR